VENDSFTANWSTVEGATGFKLDVYRMVEGGYATDLFISEYIEGSSSNKYIEIYNGTGSSIDLSNYKLELYSNGASTATNSVILSGSLEHDASVVYKNSSAALTLPIGVTATVNSAVNFSGNDAVALGNFGQHGLRAAGMREKLEQRGKESKS
jgi:predicted extracellular nuclease